MTSFNLTLKVSAVGTRRIKRQNYVKINDMRRDENEG